ncbi:MAG: hypothetical protein Q7T01_00745 [bacterium]|nr:hypothetical protein [bacterium]
MRSLFLAAVTVPIWEPMKWFWFAMAIPGGYVTFRRWKRRQMPGPSSP